MPVTFDRTTGAAVDLHTWLADAALDRSEASAQLPPTLRPAFRRLIMANAGEVEADCREAMADEEFWDIGLDRRGLIFRPELPHVVAACADDELVPWAKLARFLTPARPGRTRELGDTLRCAAPQDEQASGLGERFSSSG